MKRKDFVVANKYFFHNLYQVYYIKYKYNNIRKKKNITKELFFE